MVITDLIFLIGNVILAVSLIPSITSKNKPHLVTSLITFLVLSGFSFALSLQALYISGISTAVVAVLWWILFVQALAYKRKTQTMKHEQRIYLALEALYRIRGRMVLEDQEQFLFVHEPDFDKRLGKYCNIMRIKKML